MEKFVSSTPPPEKINAPLVHKIENLYCLIYQLGAKIPKRDRFGIYAKIETLTLQALELAISAALETKTRKLTFLNALRIKIEVLKHLIRQCQELRIIGTKLYFMLSQELIEISKMTNGWIKYLQ